MSETNCCEHGDHPAPPGKRFCSKACQRCDRDSTGPNGCDGICAPDVRATAHAEGFAAGVEAARKAVAALTTVDACGTECCDCAGLGLDAALAAIRALKP